MAPPALAGGPTVKAVFALSACPAGPVRTRAARPAITRLHGKAAPVIPARLAGTSEAWLRAAGTVPDLRLFGGLAHGVDDRVLSVPFGHRA